MSNSLPLRFQISDWHQLNKCVSNNSRDLTLHVTDFVQDDRLVGLRITVEHNVFGILFACLLNASGTMITEPDNYIEFTPTKILSELARFGFYVVYNPREHLSSKQLEYLRTLDKLHYDKIRILSVNDPATLSNDVIMYVIAFQVDMCPNWIYNDYVATKSEYMDALANGAAINISKISDTQSFNWSWLDYVANISDVLKDNGEVI